VRPKKVDGNLGENIFLDFNAHLLYHIEEEFLMNVNEIKNGLICRKPNSAKNINPLPFSILQRRYSNQRISDVRFVFFKEKSDTLLLSNEPKTVETHITKRSDGDPIEPRYPIDANDTGTIEIKKKYNKLYDKYLKLIYEINNLKNENEKLKLLAYKSYNDLKEEMAYEISRAAMDKDSLLILMELRENKKLNYVELQDRITRPEDLFPRLLDLFCINFIKQDEKSDDFSITFRGIEFLEKRGL
jgi:hypothetical protein